jgi:hypothetical protein
MRISRILLAAFGWVLAGAAAAQPAPPPLPRESMALDPKYDGP